VFVADDPGHLETPAVVALSTPGVQSEHAGRYRHLGVADRPTSVRIDDLSGQRPAFGELDPERAPSPRV